MKKIAILGSTGSIGTQTLEVVRANKDIEVTALAAGSNIDLLEKQIREFSSERSRRSGTRKKAKELKDRVRDLDIQCRERHGRTARSGNGAGCGDCGDSGSRHDRYPPDHRSDECWKRYCT